MSDVYGGVLCAGFGTRMAPITEVLPKPLIPFLNTPLITYALNHLARAGVTRVGCNLHHLADAIPPVVDRIAAAFGVAPVYAREWEILGTSGGIRGIWSALDEPEGILVVLNGDSVMNLDLAEHIERHRASGARVTLVVREKDDRQPGRVWCDAAGVLRGLRDFRHAASPPDSALTEFDFTGVHIIDSSLLAEIPLEAGDIITNVYGPMLERGEAIHASVMDGFWAALDNPTLYLDTQRRCLEEPGLFEQAPLPEAMAEGLFIYRPGTIDDTVRMAQPVLVGMNTSLAAGVEVGPNVAADGVELLPGAKVSNAALFGMGRIEGEWRDCVCVAGKIASATPPTSSQDAGAEEE